MTWQAWRLIRRGAPLVGAAAGGVAGGLLGTELGIAGAAAGGVVGRWAQQLGDHVGAVEQHRKGPSRRRMHGSIPADITTFVGRTRELEALRQFHEEIASGLIMLYGFGGCGKSATLKRFVQESGFFDPAQNRIAFLWSFSQDQNLEHFFTALNNFVGSLLPAGDARRAALDAATYLDLPDLIAETHEQIDLFLDAIEIVTVSGDSRDGRDGALAVPALRALLERAAAGGCGRLKVYCTTRVVPPELESLMAPWSPRPADNETHAHRAAALDLTAFATEDGVKLLTEKGVAGAPHLLASLVTLMRQHAYSVSLMGDLLRRAFRGDARQASEVLAATKLVSPLHQILNWYTDRLESDELAVLQAASLFRGGVLPDDLALLVGHVAKALGGSSARAPVGTVSAVTSGLADAGLVFLERQAEDGRSLVVLHPVVRDYFYKQIADPVAFHREAYRIVEAQTPEAANIESPNEYGLLKELVVQAVGAGDVKLAWRIYSERIGGYPAIGYRLADHPSGTELIGMLLDDAVGRAELPAEALIDLYVDGALYLTNEGRPDDALALLGARMPVPGRQHVERETSLLLVRAGIELLRGDLRSAITTIDDAAVLFAGGVEDMPKVDATRIEKELLTRRASATFARGEGSVGRFAEAEAISLLPGTVPHDYGPIRHIWALTLLGETEAADELAETAIVYPATIGAHMLAQRVAAMAAASACWAGDAERAWHWRGSIAPWAIKADIHMAVLSQLTHGILAFRQGRHDVAEQSLAWTATFAGNNGFLLEWLDTMALRSVNALRRCEIDDAVKLSRTVVGGDPTTYLVPLSGAASRAVEYVWPLATADAILSAHASRDRTAEPLIPRRLEPKLDFVRTSGNILLAAAREGLG